MIKFNINKAGNNNNKVRRCNKNCSGKCDRCNYYDGYNEECEDGEDPDYCNGPYGDSSDDDDDEDD